MNGFEFFEQFIKQYSEQARAVAFFIMSSGIQLEEYSQVMNTPYLETYLPKPLERESFVELVIPAMEKLAPVRKW